MDPGRGPSDCAVRGELAFECVEDRFIQWRMPPKFPKGFFVLAVGTDQGSAKIFADERFKLPTGEA